MRLGLSVREPQPQPTDAVPAVWSSRAQYFVTITGNRYTRLQALGISLGEEETIFRRLLRLSVCHVVWQKGMKGNWE